MYCKKFITLCVCVIALCTACNDEKESTLNINSIQGRSLVEGKISYNSGDIRTTEGDIKYDQYSVLANKTVYLYLDLSSLGESYDGKLVYTAVTGNDGTFAVEVPANNNGIKYTINVESFKTQRTVYSSTNDNFSIKNYYFTNTDVVPGEFTVFDNLGVYKEIELDNKVEID